jgi:hypothetical protein
MSSRPDKCRTCNSSDKVVGNYCADCTTNLVRNKVGWDKVKWWGGQYSGDASAHLRADKQVLFNNLLTGYALGGHEVDEDDNILREGIMWVVTQSPPSRESVDNLDKKVSKAIDIIKRRMRAKTE